jgi:predicted nucleic acid-binding protein
VRREPVFADAFYWVGLLNPDDQWHEPVRRVAARLGRRRIVTTEEVLLEVMAALSGLGPGRRRAAVTAVRRLLSGPGAEVVPESHDSFLAGLALYEARPDKAYSLVDCISMETMRARGLREVLTGDHHFEQEGFVRLFGEEDPPRP